MKMLATKKDYLGHRFPPEAKKLASKFQGYMSSRSLRKNYLMRRRTLTPPWAGEKSYSSSNSTAECALYRRKRRKKLQKKRLSMKSMRMIRGATLPPHAYQEAA